jgi:hypothetical protein
VVPQLFLQSVFLSRDLQRRLRGHAEVGSVWSVLSFASSGFAVHVAFVFLVRASEGWITHDDLTIDRLIVVVARRRVFCAVMRGVRAPVCCCCVVRDLRFSFFLNFCV